MGIVVSILIVLYLFFFFLGKDVLSDSASVPYAVSTGLFSGRPPSALGTITANLSTWAYASTGNQHQNKSAVPTNASISDPCRYLEQSYAGGDCMAIVGTVDVYYWPQPGADTSCLSIVGDATMPPLQNATITTTSLSGTGWTTVTYWGCTPLPGADYLTTAQMATIDGSSFKSYRVNPWSQPCGESASEWASFNSLNSHPLQARGHTLAPAPNATKDGDLHPTTVTSGTFTFISPSIYANFHNVTIEVSPDWTSNNVVCSIIPVSMLTFSPGELSTTEGGIHAMIPEGYGPYVNRPQAPQPYNFADLPCPPQSIMEANWYIPEPGVPYQPKIAMPNQLYNINPVFSSCEIFLFTGYDPPRTLAPATAMAPIITSSSPKTTAPAAAPSPTQDPGAPRTGAYDSSAGTATNDPSSPKTQGSTQPQEPDTPGEDSGVSRPVDDPSRGDTSKHDSPGNNEELGQASVSSPSVQQGSSGDADRTHEPGSANTGVASIGDPTEDSDNSLDPQNYAIAIGSQKPSRPTTVNGQLAEPLNNGISIAGFTVTPNAAPITADGTRIFLGSSALVVGSVSVPIVLTPVPLIPGQATSLNGHIVQPLTEGVSIAGQTLTPGASPITISGTPISLGPSSLVIGSSSFAVTMPRESWIPGQVTTVNGQVIQPLTNGGISINGITLTPGASPITISGTPVSLGPSSLIIGSSSFAVSLPRQSWTPGQVTTINGQIIQPLTNGGISIDGTTLTPNAPPITVSGTSISLGSSALVIGSSTMSLDSEVPEHLVTTVAGQVITADPTAVELGSLTLTPGGPGTSLSGTWVSLDSNGQLIVGTRTIPLETMSGGLGGLIMGGFRPGGPYATSSAGLGSVSGSGNSTATGNGVQAFEGSGKSSKDSSLWKLTMVIFLTLLI